jgi:hypothetical protein
MAALFLFMDGETARSAVDVGAGFTSTTSGRTVPALSATYKWGKTALTGFTTGVSTPLYYHSGYLLNIYGVWDVGKFLGGDITAGFGGGLYYGERGYRETTAAAVSKSSDFDFGPAVKVQWQPFHPLYFALDGMFGLKSVVPNLTLSYQDVILFSAGFSL